MAFSYRPRSLWVLSALTFRLLSTSCKIFPPTGSFNQINPCSSLAAELAWATGLDGKSGGGKEKKTWRDEGGGETDGQDFDA